MDGRVAITEAGAGLEVELPAEEVHAIGGVVIARLRHISQKGDTVIQAGDHFTVEEVSDRGVQKLRVERVGQYGDIHWYVVLTAAMIHCSIRCYTPGSYFRNSPCGTEAVLHRASHASASPSSTSMVILEPQAGRVDIDLCLSRSC